MSGAWMVSDSSVSHRYSLVDINDHEPEFGPFPTREAAEEFAAMNRFYFAHQWPVRREARS